MTIRTKTIEYAFAASIASVASTTARDFTQLAALAIPESTSRTFRSVTLEVACIDNAGAAASITAVLMGIKLGAVARDDATVSFTLVNSGENQGFIWTRDVTSYFQTNYTGTTMTADCRLTVTGLSTINANAKLIITYEFDDSGQNTRIKTVKIPMDGNTGNLTTSFVNLGGVASQIPALDSFLPESSKTYRSIFFQMDIHSGTTAAATSNLDMSYNGGSTTVSDTSWGWTLNSDIWMRRIDLLTATLTTSSAQSIQAKAVSTTGSPCPCLNGVLVVTYEYDHANSTTIMNSVQMVLGAERFFTALTATGDKQRFETPFSIQEPGTITLVQSGVQWSQVCSGSATIDIRCGSQAARTFAHAAAAHCGGWSSMRRIDSGESGGTAGITLARGFNELTFDIFGSSATGGNLGTMGDGVLYLNYTSDKHSDGADVHAQTRHWIVRAYATGNDVQRLQVAGLRTPIIPETDFYLNAVNTMTYLITTSPGAIAIHCEVQSGEAQGAGWRPLLSHGYESDAEMGVQLMYGRGEREREWLTYPSDLSPNALNVETARDFRFDAGGPPGGSIVSTFQTAMLVTYHAIKYTISGSVTGSAGGTVNIAAHRTDTGEKVATTSRSGNGSYSMTWFDNTVNVFTEARESSTLLGRSDDALAA